MTIPAALGWLWKVIRIAGLAVLLVVGLGLGALYLEHNRPLTLPPPTGPYAVGRLVTTWVDTLRPDPYAPPPGHPRELLVWIWYPARPSAASRPADYLPGFWRAASDPQASRFLTTFLWRNPARVRAASLEEADPIPVDGGLPVVMLRSGIGAPAYYYTTLAEDLASHGYVVVGADTPYSTWSVVMPDGRVIHKTDQGNPGDALITDEERTRRLDALLTVWVADARFLLDRVTWLNQSDPSGRLRGRLDLGAVAVAGHSFGGATAAEVTRTDPRVRAGIDLDGALYGPGAREGIGRPFLFLLSDHGERPDSADRAIREGILAVARHDPGTTLVVTLRGTGHFSFSDVPLIQSRLLGSLLRRLGGPGGTLDPRTALAWTTRSVREFLEAHLRVLRGVAP